MSDPAAILQALHRGGYHVTAPRRAMAQLIAERQGWFSAEDLVRAGQREHRHVGRATVFRSLEIFEALGVVERVHLARGEHAYVVCDAARHHHHVVCTRCGRSMDVGDIDIEPITRSIEARTAFLVESHRIEFSGLCPECQGETATRT